MKQVVKVFGPNLNRQHQQKGTFHVHAPGCSHCGQYRGYEETTMNVSSVKEIVEILFSDFDEPLENNASEVYVAPCVKLTWEG